MPSTGFRATTRNGTGTRSRARRPMIDRTGEIQRVIDEKGRLRDAGGEVEPAPLALDAYMNSLYRGLKRPAGIGGRLHASGGDGPPPHAACSRSRAACGRSTTTSSGSSSTTRCEGWDDLLALLEGDQHELFRRVETHVRARGLGDVVDSWEPDVPFMRGDAMIAPARRVAYDVVLRVFEEDAYADRALRHRGRAASTRATARSRSGSRTGPSSACRTLDHALEEVGRRPMRKLDPPVRAALRIGAYQLAYLDAVPAYAAVGESVELVRPAGLERAVKFTNAVLRRFTLGDRTRIARTTPAEAALAHSYPDWVAETWWREMGDRGRPRAHARPERAARRPLCGSSAARSRARGRTSRARTGSRGSTRRRSRRAGSGRRAAARSWRGSRSAHGRASDARPLRSARREGDDARGDVVAIEKHPGRARELEENVRRLGAANVSSYAPTASRYHPS